MTQQVFCTRCNAHTQQKARLLLPTGIEEDAADLVFDCTRCGIRNSGEEPYLPCPSCGMLTRPGDELHHPACDNATAG